MAIRKGELLEYFKSINGYPECDMIEDSSDPCIRHVCLGGRDIQLLPRQTFVFETEEGPIPMNYYKCLNCGKIIIDRNFV